eukprot:TRINITY_DN34968_c0_g1_i1.p1 TRINITY_DN34968_c0_g1~~TRINITY_DN34968_c0_g1_i1.p1  ORF type:complete len:956 (-),score=276.38 TRINITY_DN34968_c0_g1_i1:83-2950(-)
MAAQWGSQNVPQQMMVAPANMQMQAPAGYAMCMVPTDVAMSMMNGGQNGVANAPQVWLPAHQMQQGGGAFMAVMPAHMNPSVAPFMPAQMPAANQAQQQPQQAQQPGAQNATPEASPQPVVRKKLIQNQKISRPDANGNQTVTPAGTAAAAAAPAPVLEKSAFPELPEAAASVAGAKKSTTLSSLNLEFSQSARLRATSKAMAADNNAKAVTGLKQGLLPKAKSPALGPQAAKVAAPTAEVAPQPIEAAVSKASPAGPTSSPAATASVSPAAAVAKAGAKDVQRPAGPQGGSPVPAKAAAKVDAAAGSKPADKKPEEEKKKEAEPEVDKSIHAADAFPSLGLAAAGPKPGKGMRGKKGSIPMPTPAPMPATPAASSSSRLENSAWGKKAAVKVTDAKSAPETEESASAAEPNASASAAKEPRSPSPKLAEEVKPRSPSPKATASNGKKSEAMEAATRTPSESSPPASEGDNQSEVGSKENEKRSAEQQSSAASPEKQQTQPRPQAVAIQAPAGNAGIGVFPVMTPVTVTPATPAASSPEANSSAFFGASCLESRTNLLLFRFDAGAEPEEVVSFVAKEHESAWPPESFTPSMPSTPTDRALFGSQLRTGNDNRDRRGDRRDRDRRPQEQLPTSSENAYKRLSKVEALDRMSELKRSAQSLLNKICPENVNSIAVKIGALKVATVEELQLVIGLIFKKALTEPHYCETYADLVYALKNEMPEFTCTDGGKPLTFKKCLLNICQNEFESMPKVIGLSPEEAAKCDLEEKDYHEQQIKKRVLANIKLIGNLYLRQLLTARIIGSILAELTIVHKPDSIPEEHMVECVCELLSGIGLALESAEGGSTVVTQVCGRLLDLKQRKNSFNKGVYSKRIQFAIQDLLDMRQAGWTKKVFKAQAKTKEEIRQDQEKEIAAKARGQAVSSGATMVSAGARPAYLSPDNAGGAGWQDASKSRRERR